MLEDQRRIRRDRGQKIEAGCMRGLIGGQRQALAMRQQADVDLDRSAQAIFSALFFSALSACRLSATWAISAIATCSLVITGHESTSLSSPFRDSKCTVLRSPPITPVAGETSLATIQSQPLPFSL